MNRTIYVALLDEGVDVWRPVAAEQLDDDTYLILDQRYNQHIEKWEFPPGSVVHVERRTLDDGVKLVALSRAE